MDSVSGVWGWKVTARVAVMQFLPLPPSARLHVPSLVVPSTRTVKRSPCPLGTTTKLPRSRLSLATQFGSGS
jgi:hypothetical protein